MATDPIADFYDRFNTLPKLLSDLAFGIGEAQRRMDEGYLKDLAEFAKVVVNLVGNDAAAADRFLNLFKNMGPTRQQITETVVEVRTDMQMTTAREFGGELKLGITVPFAVSINASYTQRNAYDFRAAALIRMTINAIPSSESVMNALLPRAGEIIHAELPSSDRYKALLQAFEGAFKHALPQGSPPSH